MFLLLGIKVNTSPFRDVKRVRETGTENLERGFISNASFVAAGHGHPSKRRLRRQFQILRFQVEGAASVAPSIGRELPILPEDQRLRARVLPGDGEVFDLRGQLAAQGSNEIGHL